VGGPFEREGEALQNAGLIQKGGMVTEAKKAPRRQCKQRPWKVGSDPYDIPGEYDVEKHRNLKAAIARPGDLRDPGDGICMMACHETSVGKKLRRQQVSKIFKEGCEHHCARCGYGWGQHYPGKAYNQREKCPGCGLTGFTCTGKPRHQKPVRETEFHGSPLIITEGSSGLWHYHLSGELTFFRGLCGKETMQTAMPLSTWRVPFGEHFTKRPTFCTECDELFELLKKEGHAPRMPSARTAADSIAPPDPWKFKKDELMRVFREMSDAERGDFFCELFNEFCHCGQKEPCYCGREK